MKLSPWMPVPGNEYCCMRIRVGGDPTNVGDRYAFIEKTPRVRIRDASHRISVSGQSQWGEWLDWCYGHGGDSGERQADGTYIYEKESQEWCDGVLIALGHELT